MKPVADLSFKARSIVQWLQVDGYEFLTAQQARAKMEAVYELMEESYLVPSTQNGDNGYILTPMAKRHLNPKETKELGTMAGTIAYIAPDFDDELEFD